MVFLLYCYLSSTQRSFQMSLLNDKINSDIDAIIEQLVQVKKTNSYFGRISELESIAKSIENTSFYWDEKLRNLID